MRILTLKTEEKQGRTKFELYEGEELVQWLHSRKSMLNEWKHYDEFIDWLQGYLDEELLEEIHHKAEELSEDDDTYYFVNAIYKFKDVEYLFHVKDTLFSSHNAHLEDLIDFMNEEVLGKLNVKIEYDGIY